MKYAAAIAALFIASVAMAASPLDYASQSDLTYGGKFKKLECHATHETICDRQGRCGPLNESPMQKDAEGKDQPSVRFALDLQMRNFCLNGCRAPQHMTGLSAEKRNDNFDMRWNATLSGAKLTLIALGLADPKTTQFHYNRSKPQPKNEMNQQSIEFGRCTVLP